MRLRVPMLGAEDLLAVAPHDHDDAQLAVTLGAPQLLRLDRLGGMVVNRRRLLAGKFALDAVAVVGGGIDASVNLSDRGRGHAFVAEQFFRGALREASAGVSFEE